MASNAVIQFELICRVWYTPDGASWVIRKQMKENCRP